MTFDWLKRQNFREMRKRWQWLDDAVSSGGGGGGGGMPENPLAIAHGGHGGTTLAEAQENLEITPLPEASATDAGKVYGIGNNGDIVLDYPPSELPTVTTTDNNKALVVVSGKWEKADIPTELPAVTTADEGKLLGVDNAGEWAAVDAPDELPSATTADNGKALIVSAGKWTADSIPQQLPVPTTSDKDKIPTAQADGTYALKAQKEELPQSTTSDVNKALAVNAAGKPEWKMLTADATPAKKTLTTMDTASSHFSGGNVTLTMSGNVGVLRFEEVYFSASMLTFAADGRCTISFTVPLGSSSGYKFAAGCSINYASTKLADVTHGESHSLMGYKLGVTGATGMTAFNCDLTFYKPDYALGATDIVRLGDEVCVVLEKEGA